MADVVEADLYARRDLVDRVVITAVKERQRRERILHRIVGHVLRSAFAPALPVPPLGFKLLDAGGVSQHDVAQFFCRMC